MNMIPTMTITTRNQFHEKVIGAAKTFPELVRYPDVMTLWKEEFEIFVFDDTFDLVQNEDNITNHSSLVVTISEDVLSILSMIREKVWGENTTFRCYMKDNYKSIEYGMIDDIPFVTIQTVYEDTHGKTKRGKILVIDDIGSFLNACNTVTEMDKFLIERYDEAQKRKDENNG